MKLSHMQTFIYNLTIAFLLYLFFKVIISSFNKVRKLNIRYITSIYTVGEQECDFFIFSHQLESSLNPAFLNDVSSKITIREWILKTTEMYMNEIQEKIIKTDKTDEFATCNSVFNALSPQFYNTKILDKYITSECLEPCKIIVYYNIYLSLKNYYENNELHHTFYSYYVYMNISQLNIIQRMLSYGNKNVFFNLDGSLNLITLLIELTLKKPGLYSIHEIHINITRLLITKMYQFRNKPLKSVFLEIYDLFALNGMEAILSKIPMQKGVRILVLTDSSYEPEWITRFLKLGGNNESAIKYFQNNDDKIRKFIGIINSTVNNMELLISKEMKYTTYNQNFSKNRANIIDMFNSELKIIFTAKFTVQDIVLQLVSNKSKNNDYIGDFKPRNTCRIYRI